MTISHFELEDRNCINEKCTSVWRCLPNDANFYCSENCRILDTKDGGERLKLMQKIRNPNTMIAAKTGICGTMARGGQKSKLNIESKNVKKESKSAETRSMPDVEKSTTQKKTGKDGRIVTALKENESVKLSIGMKIAKKLTSDKGSIMNETGITNLVKSTNEGVNETLPTVSTEQLQITKTVQSDTMSLLDDSAKHLYSLMKGLTKNHIPEMVEKGPSYESERVITAVACAREIRELMKVKISAADLAHKMLNGNHGVKNEKRR